jgi:hypothetical protein
MIRACRSSWLASIELIDGRLIMALCSSCLEVEGELISLCICVGISSKDSGLGLMHKSAP